MNSVVMLHGWGMNASVFDALAAELAADFEVTASDLPGYGSSRECKPYTLQNLASSVAASAPPRCSVVGWSLGAQVALEWARTRPQQIGALVLMGATPCFVQRQDWTCAMEVATFGGFEDALAIDSAAALERFVSLQAQGDSDARGVMRRLRDTLSAVETPRTEILRSGLEILRTSDLRPSLREIEQPVLVVQGELDRLVPARAGDYLAQTLHAARLATVRGAAHASFISQPQSVSRMIAEFFRDH